MDVTGTLLIVNIHREWVDAHGVKLRGVKAPVYVLTGPDDCLHGVDALEFYRVVARVPDIRDFSIVTIVFETTDSIRVVNIGRNIVIAADPVERGDVLIVCEEKVYYTGVIDLACTVRVGVSSVEVYHIKLARNVIVYVNLLRAQTVEFKRRVVKKPNQVLALLNLVQDKFTKSCVGDLSIILCVEGLVLLRHEIEE